MPKPDSNPINLIIAVSFGLFVPPRLIHAVKYGGLNVHPSILPDLRGPAPIHHALLRGDSHTGITIQTLSTEAFDHGIPLLQTPPTNLFPILPDHTPTQLQAELAVEGAKMLVQTLREGLHVPPHQSCQAANDGGYAVASHQPPLQHAPKITPQDRQILWTADNLTSEDIIRRARVLGPLWTHLIVNEKGEERVKRVILEDLTAVTGTPRPPKLKPNPNPGSWKNGTWVPAVDTRKGVGEMTSVGKGSAEDGELTWVQKTPILQTNGGGKGEANLEWETENVRMGYWVGKKRGDEGVTVRVSRQSWLRIGKIKVEGSTAKPAKVVLEAKV
ncbi:formyl transferase [Dichotomopilus funicola]|uniref:Formyl transferase n=1 Tax=Dichotomopilus funicola TaxID=1934379 RepID=A0AAN6VAT2_9PEZI|nr:formyl transferase [Dichotomopilus funicola]